MADATLSKINRRFRRLSRRRSIECNFCGRRFTSYDVPYSESQECPNCGSVARERVIYAVILERFSPDSRSIAGSGGDLAKVSLLELSPRNLPQKRDIYQAAFKRYTASDFDLRGHQGEVKLDLTSSADVAALKGKYDIVICAHVFEHIPEYERALNNLSSLIGRKGLALFQVPFIESRYTPVTWDEFHGDDTRAYHRFAFDLSPTLEQHFKRVELYLASKQPKATSSDVDSRKYQALVHHSGRVVEIDPRLRRRNGLGSPDMCEVYVLSNVATTKSSRS